MLETRVLIVGGGPAGSTLAWALSRYGIRSVIMDKARFPRQKVCAGWITPMVMQELEIDVSEYARQFTLQPIHAFQTGIMGKTPVRSDFNGEPASYGIRRLEFDHFLLKRCGAVVRQGEAVRSMRLDGDAWVVNEAVKAPLVIGAGGHFCPVAQRINLGNPDGAIVAAQEIEFQMSPGQLRQCAVEGEEPRLLFARDLKGYGWVIRKGDYLNIGLGREDKRKLSAHVRDFHTRLAAAGIVPGDLPGKFRGHAYLLYPHARRQIVEHGIMLIGDAAGLAYEHSGEGIRPAVESALLAAAVIRDCHDAYSADKLNAYVTELERRFGKRKPPATWKERLPAGLRQTMAGLLMKNRWLSKKLLIERWFLHRQDKSLCLS
jgi:flavin-dependent dehydrogenase